MSVFLGIDIGTASTKTLAVDETGKILAEAVAEYPLHTPKPGWTEQNPDDWWNAVVKTVKAAVAEAGLKPADVKAIGLSGQMHGSVFLDKQGQVIRPALLWNDNRTVAECREITERAGGRERLIEMVANPALTGFTAPKILWLRNHEPRNFDRLAKVLLPKDDVRRRLTGEFATEVSDASGMLLLDVKARDWSKELLGKLELDPGLFGKVYESADVTGTLTAAAAEELGLSTACLVVGGAGDCAAGAVGNGIVREGVLSTSLGTSGVMFVHSEQPAVDPLGRLHTFCHAVRGKWHMMGVNLSAAGCLQWFRNALCRADMQLAEQRRVDVYDLLLQEAAAVPAGSEGLYFLPYLSGERTPHADPLARGCFVGLGLTHGRGHLLRAVLEGVTYNLRESLEIIRGLDVPVHEIRVGGGGSKGPLWRRIQAEVFGQEVVRTNAEQGAAYGVALLAAVGGGAFADIAEACGATIHVAERIPCDAASRAAYDRAFPVYKSLYPTLADSFKRIAEAT